MVRVLGNGKILVVGRARDNFAVARLNADGSPDRSFGGGDGRVTTHFAAVDEAFDLAVLPDGGFVVVGSANNDLAVGLARYRPDGRLESSFGKRGKVTEFVSGKTFGRAIAVHGDSILVAATAGDDLAVLRFDLASGRLDRTFGRNGVARHNVSGVDRAEALAVQADGKILIAGTSSLQSGGDFALLRLTGDGKQLDTRFGNRSPGKTTLNLSGADRGHALHVFGDGKILMAGGNGAGDWAVVRFDARGRVDTGFGRRGIATIDNPSDGEARDLAVQPDGKIVLAGRGNRADIGVARLLSDGRPDTGFAPRGIVTLNISGDDEGNGLALQNDGRILVTGQGGISLRVLRFRIENRPPQAVDDNATLTSRRSTELDVLENDSDPDGDPLAITQLGSRSGSNNKRSESGGRLKLLNNGRVQYQPPANEVSTDRFFYSISDGQETRVAVVNIVFDVPSGNRPPVANDDSFTVGSDSPVTLNVTSNDSDPDDDELVVSEVGLLRNGNWVATSREGGSVQRMADGSVRYTPPDGKTIATDSFQYEIRDTEGAADIGNVALTLNTEGGPGNGGGGSGGGGAGGGGSTSPNATRDDFIYLPSPTAQVDADVLANDNAAGRALSIQAIDSVQPAGGGSAQIVAGDDGRQRIRFQATPGFVGRVAVTYTAEYANGTRGSATLTVKVGNRGIEAYEPGLSTRVNRKLKLAISELAGDPDHDPIGVSTWTKKSAEGGRVRRLGDQLIVYKPPRNFRGTDSFRATITDGFGAKARVTVRIQVGNRAPQAKADREFTAADRPLDIRVLRNDTDPDKDPLKVADFTQPAHGTVTRTGARGNMLHYQPASGFTGNDSFTYTVEDPWGKKDTATVRVHVEGGEQNHDPVARPDRVHTNKNRAVRIPVRRNDRDPDGDRLSVVSFQKRPEHGRVKRVKGRPNVLRYIPHPNYVGVDTFTYTVDDGNGGRDTARVLVLVGDPASRSGPPSARIVQGDETWRFPAVGVVGDARDNFCTGTLISPTHALTAAHCVDELGPRQARFSVGGKTYHSSRIFIHPGYGKANDIDVAVIELSEPVTNVEPMELYRQTPAVGQRVTIVGFGAGGTGEDGHDFDFGTKREGTTTLDRVDANRIYWKFDAPDESNTAPGDSGGPALIEVDGRQLIAGITEAGTRFDAGYGDRSSDMRIDTVAAWIDGLARNQAPVIKPIRIVVRPGETVRIPVLEYASDADGDTLKLLAPGRPSAGEVRRLPRQPDVLEYTAPQGAAAPSAAQIPIRVSDGRGLVAAGTIEISVRNQAPLAAADRVSLRPGQTVDLDLLANDRDPDGDALRIRWKRTSQPAHGSWTQHPRNERLLRYTAPKSGVAQDHFTYEVGDGYGGVSQATVTIQIANQAPVAVDDHAETHRGQAVNIAVLGNDREPDGDSLRLRPRHLGRARHGKVVVHPSRPHLLRYTPAPGFSGTDSFTYEVGDGHGGVAKATVHVRVRAFRHERGVVYVDGGGRSDEASIGVENGRLVVRLNHHAEAYLPTAVQRVEFRGGAGNDRFVNHTSVPLHAWGEDGADQLVGGTSADQLFGGQGNDYLAGNAGNDLLHGGRGRDRLWGSAGHDQIFGGDGNDLLYGESGDDVMEGNAGNDILEGGTENDTLKGNEGNDLLKGQDGFDHLYAGYGNDTLRGGTGNDYLKSQDGVAGNDQLFGGAGDDFLDAPRRERKD